MKETRLLLDDWENLENGFENGISSGLYDLPWLKVVGNWRSEQAGEQGTVMINHPWFDP